MWPAELASARYAHLLEPPASDLVHALKYEGWRELAHPMGRAIARIARGHAERRAGQRAGTAAGGAAGGPAVPLVVPVPTTRRRVRSRGYNQARLLAGVVAAELGLPLVDALERRSTPRSQTTLSPAERRENVRDAFGPSEHVRRVRGRRTYLVDDVLTTGATAGEAAKVLAAHGASEVRLLTFGRALARPGRTGGRAA